MIKLYRTLIFVKRGVMDKIISSLSVTPAGLSYGSQPGYYGLIDCHYIAPSVHYS